MKIASIDPGGITGVVLIDIGKWPIQSMRTAAHLMIKRAIDSGKLKWMDVKGPEEKQVWELYRLVKNHDVVIYEDYIPRAPIKTTKRESLSPVRISFGLELLLNKSEKFNGKVVRQQSTQMGVITDERLKRWGLWVVGSKDVRSAMKHLVIYLRDRPIG
jgi:hypothetical protein